MAGGIEIETHAGPLPAVRAVSTAPTTRGCAGGRSAGAASTASSAAGEHALRAVGDRDSAPWRRPSPQACRPRARRRRPAPAGGIRRGAVRRARRAALACSGAVALTKRKLIDWLLTHDFEELPRRATSHRRFRGPGTTLTLPAHGRAELSAKHTGMLIRELETAGFDRHQIRQELGL